MDGLYKRALALLRQEQLLKVIKRDSSVSTAVLDIPEAESEEILSQIDQVVSKNKLIINKKTLSFKARKRGFGLPLVVNLVAILVIVAGALVISYFFGLKEESIVTGSIGITSAEGRLIEKLKEESQAEIALKEEEIAATRSKLQDMAMEKDRLESEMDQRISDREAELRSALEQELEAERVRLAEEGIFQEDIDLLIKELESARAAEYSSQLDTFRQEALTELQEKSAAIAALTAEYEQTLARQEEEQQKLLVQLQAREAELEEQLKRQEAALEQERTAFAEDLSRIQRQQESRQLVLDQIRSSYEKINSYLDESDYSRALGQLATLEDYLRQDGVAGLSSMQDQIHVEFFIIDSLNKLIENEQENAGSDTTSLVQAAAKLTAVSGMVEEADSLFRNGEIERATDLYLTALNEIPDLGRSYKRLQEIEEMTFHRRREDLSRLIRSGDSLYSSGNYQASLHQYKQALEVLKEDSVDFNRLVDRISEAGFSIGVAEITASENKEAARLVAQSDQLYAADDYGAAIAAYASAIQRYPNSTYLETAMEGLQKSMKMLIGKLEGDIAEAEEELNTMEGLIGKLERDIAEAGTVVAQTDLVDNAELIQRLESIKSLYAGYSAFSEGTGERSQEELYSLLQAKLLMKRVLNSEEVRAEYPELYDSVQKYYEAYGQEKWQEGRYSTMRDMVAFIDILANPESYSESDVTQTTAELAYQKELFAEFLEKLQALLQ